ASLAVGAHNRATAGALATLPTGWRNIRSQPQRRRFSVGGDEIEVAHVVDRRGLTVEGRDDVHLVSVAPDRVVLEVGGIARAFATAIHATNGGTEVFVDGPLGPVALTVVDRFPDPADQTA